ncbi:MAG: ABC transporter permease [Rhodoblastus sp.]
MHAPGAVRNVSQNAVNAGAWRRTARLNGFTAIGLAGTILALAPLAALAVIAAQGDGAALVHVLRHVAGAAAVQTAFLLGGVAICILLLGVGMAWLVTSWDFPGRRFAEAAAILPLALPAYVMAYAWLDLAHPIGPLQSALRDLLEVADPRDLRLPDLRSLPGAICIFSLALYPYVYIGVRAAFQSRIAAQVEAARLLGAGETGVVFRVAIPLARPAMAAGVALALMETLNDIGAAEFLSVTTLTTSVYSTWINRSDLPGAAQIALATLAIVLGLVVMERWARGARRYAAGGLRPHPPARMARGLAGLGLLALTLLPSLLGFAAPTLHLGRQALLRIAANGLPADIARETLNTLGVALAASGLCVFGAVAILAGARENFASRLQRALPRLSSVGYALPGVVLAIGLLAIFGAIDAALRALGVSLGFKPTGLILSASISAIVIALTIRFFRLAVSKIETGFQRIPVSLDNSARVLGRSQFQTLREIHIPLLTPSIAAAALLVFVDSMKELPATLLLRPMNFETLATHVYAEAARGTYENGAIAACIIILVGLAPVIFLTFVGTQPAQSAPRAGARIAASKQTLAS